MRVLRRSRRVPIVGDIFVYSMPDEMYRFGRLIRNDARMAAWTQLHVIYFYKPKVRMKLPVPLLSKEELLIPPMITMANGWRRGYFETVESRRLEASDVLETHCFWESLHECYCDEYGNRLAKRLEPCGLFTLTTEVGIDRELSRALGIPFSLPNPNHFVGKPKVMFRQRQKSLLEVGVREEVAQIEALKAALRYSGDRVEHYAWPDSRTGAYRIPKHSLPPPNARYLSGAAFLVHEELLSAFLRNGLPREKAELEAMKALVRHLGERVEDFSWPG